jgi:two-component system chemotaxis response regulator CheB
MEKIRVLVVDDSLVIRRALRECFRSDPEIEVVGVADTGVRALEQIAELKPDVVTLDIEMPEMDGLQTLKTLRERGASIPVIMFSKYTSEGATATIEALALGASDIVAKPEAHGGKGMSCEVAKRQLTTRIRAFGRKVLRGRFESSKKPKPIEQEPIIAPFTPPQGVAAVGVAISTGGPKALIEIVSVLQPSIAVPIFITQHMPPMFARFLAERLTAHGNVPACAAEDGMLAQPGKIYIAPGDFHMEIVNGDESPTIRLNKAPHENSCRPSADVMFRSLANTYGADLLSIVMTGMGQDGRRGCEHIKANGGTVVAQDEATSLVWGMPRAVITAGLHDAILPLSNIAELINASCSKPEKEQK